MPKAQAKKKVLIDERHPRLAAKALGLKTSWNYFMCFSQL
jgi:hypothetical protein